MSAVGFIIAIFVLKVILDLLSATRRGPRTGAIGQTHVDDASEDTSAIDDLRHRQAWAHHNEVITGNMLTEQYSAAAGAFSAFDDGGVEPVASDGSHFDD